MENVSVSKLDNPVDGLLRPKSYSEISNEKLF